jgi:hypothetical protein
MPCLRRMVIHRATKRVIASLNCHGTIQIVAFMNIIRAQRFAYSTGVLQRAQKIEMEALEAYPIEKTH